MNRSVNIFCAIALSVALLYSGAASAFLKCFHEWDSVSDREESEAPSSETSDSADAPELECPYPDYQLGPVIVGSVSPRMLGSTDGVLSEIYSETGASLESNRFWLKGFLGLSSPFHRLSRYLFLSVFRI